MRTHRTLPPATITTDLTTTRTLGPGGALTTATTLAATSWAGTTPTSIPGSTFTTSVAPTTGGYVTTSTPPTASLASRVYTDTRGRVIRVESPGMYPTCITYTGFSTRPTLVRTSPGTTPGDVTRGPCNATAPTTQRREVAYAYATGGLRWLTGVTEGIGTTLNTTIVPDLRGWADTITLPGRMSALDLGYDADGNVISYTPPGRTAHTVTFTPRGALSTETPPGTPAWPVDEEVVSSVYRANGSLAEQTYRNGAVIRTTLDPDTGYLQRVWTTGETSTNDVTYTNDAGGRPIAISHPSGGMTFAYVDGMLETQGWTAAPPVGGVPVGVTGSVRHVVGPLMLLDSETITIDSLGTPRTATITYGYDADRALTRASFPGTWGMHFSRSYVDGVTLTARVGDTAAAANDITTTYDSTALGEYAHADTVRNGVRLYEEYICSRDALGRVTVRGERFRTSTALTTVRVYRYDYHPTRPFLQRYREYVTQVAGTGNGLAVRCTTTGTPVQDTSYTYDEAGNRTDHTVNAADQVTAGAGTTFAYDALGQMSSRGTRTLTYDTLGRLRRTVLGTAIVDYDYDALGRLIAIRPTGTATVPRQRFIYRDGLEPVLWQRATIAPGTCPGGVTAVDNVMFLYGSREHVPDLMYYDTCGDNTVNATYRLLVDERGSVRSIVNAVTGAVAEQYLYDAWGNPRTADLLPAGSTADPVVRRPTLQPFGFTGGIWDGATGFWRLGARDYDPTIGRWTTRDPIGFSGGYNLYLYAGGDPVNYVDADGNHPVLVAIAVVVFIVSMGAAAPSDTSSHPTNVPAVALNLLTMGMCFGATSSVGTGAGLIADTEGAAFRGAEVLVRRAPSIPDLRRLSFDWAHILSRHASSAASAAGRTHWPWSWGRASIYNAIRAGYSGARVVARQEGRVLLQIPWGGPGNAPFIRMWVNTATRTVETAFPWLGYLP